MNDTIDFSSDFYELSTEERKWAGAAHFSAFLGFIFPILTFLAPLAIYWFKGDESEFIKKNAAAAVNFQITIFLMSLLTIPFIVLTFGLGIFVVLAIMLIYVIAMIRAGIEAREGYIARYPFSISLLS